MTYFQLASYPFCPTDIHCLNHLGEPNCVHPLPSQLEDVRLGEDTARYNTKSGNVELAYVPDAKKQKKPVLKEIVR